MRNTKPHLEPERTVPPVLYCIEDAAKALGIGRTLVFQLIKEGALKPVRIKGRTLISVKEVEAFPVRLGGAA